MSRADDREDDWEQRRRPRRDWQEDDYDDLPVYRAEASGAVTGVAVACFIWGGLCLLFSFCLGFLFLIAVGPGGPPPGAGGLFGGQESILGMRFLGFFVWGMGVIVAGVGLLSRRAWGRVLTLVLAAFAGLGGIGTIIEGIYLMIQVQNAAPFNRGDLVFGFMVAMLVGLLLIIFSLWVFIVLFSAKSSEEFK